MAFVGNAVRGVGKALGLIPDIPAVPATPTITAPTASNSSAQLDAAAQSQAAAMMGGKTSTMLTGAQGEEEDKKYTSKTLLGM